MKKTSLIIGLFLCFSHTVILSQTVSEFSKEPAKFQQEIANYLNTTRREDCKETADAFIELTKSGGITADQMNSIISTSNVLIKRNLTAYPYFQKYVETQLVLLKSKKGAEFYKNWTEILDKIIASQRTGDNKKFMDFLNFTDGLVMENALFKSQAKSWVIGTPNFQLSYENGEPKITVPETNVMGLVSGDTLKIGKTSGVYFPFRFLWNGNGGNVNWDRAGLDPEGVYATFKSYSIDMNRQDYSVDTVAFYFTLFFNKPIYGRFEDKMISNSKLENMSYPRFISFRDDIKIPNLAENVVYEGAFNLFGSKIYGAGETGGKATLTFYLPDGVTKALVARGKNVTIRKPVELSFTDCEVSLYFGKDSIFHPAVYLNYKIPKKEVRISRGKDGLNACRFYDSYHKTEFEADAIAWKLDRNYLELLMEEGAGQKLAPVLSQDFYSEDLFRKMTGTSEYNPLSKLWSYKQKTGVDTLNADLFAKSMSNLLTADQCLPLIFEMAAEGLIYYNKDTRKMKILPKLINYVMAKSKKIDYDIINFAAIAKSLKDPIGIINLKNNVIDFNGVDHVPFSDSSQVVIFPRHDSLKLGKNRDMEFSGMILAARLDLHGEGHKFYYDPFKIELKKVDSMIINIPADVVQYDENNMEITKPMNSKIEKLEGLLEVDHPANKSGRSPLRQFPILTSSKNSYVFYDQTGILNGVYKREKEFHFLVDPFKMDSLGKFDVPSMIFDGTLYSANIFQPYREKIYKMVDYSLGFKSKAPMSGFQAYKGKGKYTGDLRLDLNGLRGTGKVEYLSSTLNCPEIIFYPDSLTTKASEFQIAKTTSPVNTPATSAKNTPVVWTPYQDEMKIFKGDSSFQMYDDKTTFDGNLNLGAKGLYGSGKLEWAEATLSSNKIKFQSEDLESDTASLQIKSIGGDRVTFITPNVHAKVDFKNRTGKFVSNVKDIPTDFAYNQYKTTINEFDWDIDKKLLDFRSPKEEAGSYFISTRPDQYELKFLAKRGFYNLETSIMQLEQVPEIRVADSRVIPDSGKVTIDPEAKMRTLKNAKITGDTVNGYQTIVNCTVDIQSSRSLKGSGVYKYKSLDSKPYDIQISDISSYPMTIGEGKTQTTEYYISASGKIPVDQKFKLYPQIDFQGDVKFYTRDKFLSFTGYSKINFKNPKVKTDWFSVNQAVDPLQTKFNFTKPVSPEGNSILAGIALNTRDTSASMYTLIMGPKIAKSDENIFEASGMMKFNSTTNEYTFGDSMRIAGESKQGPLMTYNDNTGAVFCEGPVNIGMDFGAVENIAAGSITTNVNTNQYNLDLTLGLNLEFTKDVNERLLTLLTTDFENGDVDLSTDKFNKQMTELIVDKHEKNFFEEINKSGQVTRPKEFPYNLVLTDIKLNYDPVDVSYKSKGPIGILLYGDKGIAKKVDGYLELGTQRSSGFFNLYLKSSLGDWIFITYKSSNVQILSSLDDVNALINATDPEKRKVTRENGKFYLFALGSQTKMKAFVEKMKAYMPPK